VTSQTYDQHRFAISEVAADWYEPMVPQRIMWPSIHKFSFSNRTIPIWNSLLDYVVASPTINTFKTRLDKFRENQDVQYNWKADISFTGSRCKVELTID